MGKERIYSSYEDNENGIKIFKIHSKKFKTNEMSIFYVDVLTSKNAAKKSLLPRVLSRGNDVDINSKIINQKFQDFYTSKWGIESKRIAGNLQSIEFHIETLKKEFTMNEDFSIRAFDLMFSILTSPLMADTYEFNHCLVAAEKSNNINLIERRINNKAEYSIFRSFDFMLDESSKMIHEYGEISDYENIDAVSLYKQYEKMVKSLPVFIFVMGEFDDSFMEYVKKCFVRIRRTNVKKLSTVKLQDSLNSNNLLKEVIEILPITQNYFCTGFNLGINVRNAKWINMMVLINYFHNKAKRLLSQRGLTYNFRNEVDVFYGYLVMLAGIEISNKEIISKIIDNILQEIKNGIIEEDILNSSKVRLTDDYNGIVDNKEEFIRFSLEANILQYEFSFEDIIDKIKNTSKEDIISVSKLLNKDLHYLLSTECQEAQK